MFSYARNSTHHFSNWNLWEKQKKTQKTQNGTITQPYFKEDTQTLRITTTKINYSTALTVIHESQNEYYFNFIEHIIHLL